MDLDEIRTFVTIARERSFSGAAGTQVTSTSCQI